MPAVYFERDFAGLVAAVVARHVPVDLPPSLRLVDLGLVNGCQRFSCGGTRPTEFDVDCWVTMQDAQVCAAERHTKLIMHAPGIGVAIDAESIRRVTASVPPQVELSDLSLAEGERSLIADELSHTQVGGLGPLCDPIPAVEYQDWQTVSDIHRSAQRHRLWPCYPRPA